ncbi:cytochrome P450 [Streptomyces sp. NPDC001982]|uniref:cytochrome P450 n=1 Tax=Streptomyces sp. NPDC001982 TaxID=3154405 RepID=UPI00331B1A06
MSASSESNAERVGCPHLAGYDPLASAEIADPYPSYARARIEAPVFYDETQELWSLTRREDIVAALMDPATYSSTSALSDETPPPELLDRIPEYPWTGAVLSIDAPAHKNARAVLRAPFTPRRAEERASWARERALELLEPLERDGRIEFLREVAFPLAMTVIGDILGVPEERFELLERGVEAAHHITGRALTDHADKVRHTETLLELVDYIEELVEERRRNPGDDYVSVMVRTPRPDGRLESTEKMVKHVWTIVAAGFETTANQLALGLRWLLANRDQWDLLRSDPSLVPSAVEEILRYRTLVKRLFRRTTRDVVVAGVTIPKGELVALLTSSANRDPEAYDTDPEEIDVTRNPAHLAFGRGVHLCVGAHLARVEIRTVLEVLLARFPELDLADPDVEPGPGQLRFDTVRSLNLVCPR